MVPTGTFHDRKIGYWYAWKISTHLIDQRLSSDSYVRTHYYLVVKLLIVYRHKFSCPRLYHEVVRLEPRNSNPRQGLNPKKSAGPFSTAEKQGRKSFIC